MKRALLMVVAWASWVGGCSCGAISHPPDVSSLDGGTHTPLLDTPEATPVPDAPPRDAHCVESGTMTVSGTVLGSGADRFTETLLEPLDCEGSYSVSVSLYEAGMPFDGDSIYVSWLDASSLRGPDPVRGLDVPASVAWGSGLGPGGSVTTMMHIEHADPLYADGPRRFVASLDVDQGSDRFALAFDFVYCSFQVCL